MASHGAGKPSWARKQTKGEAKHGTWGSNKGPYKRAKIPVGGKRKARAKRYEKEAQGPPGKKTQHAAKKLSERKMKQEGEGVHGGRGVWGSRSGIHRVPQGTTRKKAASTANKVTTRTRRPRRVAIKQREAQRRNTRQERHISRKERRDSPPY